MVVIMEILSWDLGITAGLALALTDQEVVASLPVAVTKTVLHYRWCVSVKLDTRVSDLAKHN